MPKSILFLIIDRPYDYANFSYMRLPIFILKSYLVRRPRTCRRRPSSGRHSVRIDRRSPAVGVIRGYLMGMMLHRLERESGFGSLFEVLGDNPSVDNTPNRRWTGRHGLG